MRLTFLASAGRWKHKAWQKLFLAFSLPLWAMLTSQRLTPNIYDFIQRLKHLPRTTALVSHTCTHRRAHTKQFCLCICKQVSPVWHHSTTAGYGSKNRQRITVDYISTRLHSLPGISTTFLPEEMNYKLRNGQMGEPKPGTFLHTSKFFFSFFFLLKNNT